MPHLFVEYLKAQVRHQYCLLRQGVLRGTEPRATLKQLYNSKRFRRYVEEVKKQTWQNGGNLELAISMAIEDMRAADTVISQM